MSYLLAKDTVNGAEGKIFVTIDGKNMEVACMRNIKTNAEIQSNDMRVIGTRTIQNKNNGAKLTGTGNIYYGTNLFTNMVLQYIQTALCRSLTSRSPTTIRQPASAHSRWPITAVRSPERSRCRS